MSAAPPEDAPRRLVEEARDELVKSGLLALRGAGPSERSRQNLLAQLGVHVDAAPAVERSGAVRSSWQLARSIALGLCLGIALGLGWALYRRYAQ